MLDATKFYLPFFKTGCPQGKLYTYYSESNTLAPTYQNYEGALHENPIILDDKGECILYVDQYINYRYVLYDKDNNLIFDNSNLKQLSGPPGPPGQNYLTQVKIKADSVINIPAGHNCFYVTATGGGGAGASWSPYLFIVDTIDDVNTPAFLGNQTFKNLKTGAVKNTINNLKIDRHNFSTLIMPPGSGFAGQSVYRHRIPLDISTNNSIEIKLGKGGTNIENSLDGSDGQSTQIYINSNLVLELSGGPGGKNSFPKDPASVPIFPKENITLKLNFGFKQDLIYCKNNQAEISSYTSENQANYVWNTYYQDYSTVLANIQLSYTIPKIYLPSRDVAGNMYTTTNITDLNGESNVFGSYYTRYQLRYDDTSPIAFNDLKNSQKNGNNDEGWGSGGDVFYNFYSNQLFFNAYFLSNFIPAGSGDFQYLIRYSKDDFKNQVINYFKNFSTSDSAKIGVTTLPTLDDTSGVWNKVDSLYTQYSQEVNTYIYKEAGFYLLNTVRSVNTANNPNSFGGAGVDGYAIIEYGAITDHPAV